jgi:hypothetical protein
VRRWPTGALSPAPRPPPRGYGRPAPGQDSSRPDAPAQRERPVTARPEAPLSQAGATAQPDAPSRPYVFRRPGGCARRAARWLSRSAGGGGPPTWPSSPDHRHLSAVAVAVAGSQPTTPAPTSALTWLLLTGRHDLAPTP